MERKKSRLAQTPTLEWIAGGVGLILLTSLLAVIGYEAVSGASRNPPEIVVQTRGIIKIRTGYLVPFEVRNIGGTAAAALEIEGELREGNRIAETSSTTIDYVPGHSTAEGGLFYSADPNRFTVDVRPLGYRVP